LTQKGRVWYATIVLMPIRASVPIRRSEHPVDAVQRERSLAVEHEGDLGRSRDQGRRRRADSLRELCRYSLWRLFVDPGAGLADAPAVRLHALDVCRSVLRTSQQLRGAAGICDDYYVSILCRHVQPDLRLPFGAGQTTLSAFVAILDLGFDSLIPSGSRRAGAGL
jgi:hypothetical protein